MSDEDIAFCGTLMKAASGMGMVMREVKDNETQSQYELIDYVSGARIAGKPDKDKQIALFNTCKGLEKYLSSEDHKEE